MDFSRLCLELRKDIVKMYLSAGGGHLPAALSLVETLASLFFYEMNLSGDSPQVDRFHLSKGHGCLALYAVLIRKGLMAAEHGMKIGQPGSALGWHPTAGEVPGIDTSSGSLGLGASFAVGRALHGQRQSLDYRTFCVLGDGECNEGSVWEAAMAAAHKKLDRLYFLVDCNGYQANGKTSDVCNLEPFTEKWTAFGFETVSVDLQSDPQALLRLFKEPFLMKDRPKALLCYSAKGCGIPFIENNPDWHSKNKLNQADRDQLLAWMAQ